MRDICGRGCGGVNAQAKSDVPSNEARDVTGRVRSFSEFRSALRELEAAAGLDAAVLLPLHGTAVAGQEATLLEDAAQLRLVVGQRLGDAVAHRTGLTRQPAALHRRDDVILV